MKKIGVVSLFPFRPHVQNMAFITKLLIKDGYEVRVLHCDAEFDFCYYKLFNDKKSKLYPNCLTCNVGSLKHFVSDNLIDPISEYVNLTGTEKLQITEEDRVNAVNSIANVHRIENYYELSELRKTAQYKKLIQAKDKMNNAFYAWYMSNNLDGVILFNGRMDLTNSVLRISKENDFPVITVEGSGSNKGLRIIPNNNALSKKEFEHHLEKVIEKPLTIDQLKVAISFFNGRLKRDNKYEWRQYHKNATNEGFEWEADEKKVLILPSSNYEFYGNYDLSNCWKNATEGFNYIIESLNIKKKDVLVRFHPNWERTIAGYSGDKSMQHYEEFCKINGYSFIQSNSKINTQNLIEDADMILVNGGSSAIEACLMGKPVINVFPAKYSRGKFVTNIFNKSATVPDIHVSEKAIKDRIRYCLRYLYFNMRRFPQFTNSVKVKTSILNEYNMSTDSKPLINALINKSVQLSDIKFSDCCTEEDEFVNNLFADFRFYLDNSEISLANNNTEYSIIHPEGIHKFIYTLRSLFKRGDN